jgi:hypothetical protein
MRQMNSVTLNTAEFLDRMYPIAPDATEHSVARHRTRTEAIVRRIAMERVSTGRADTPLMQATAWELWNGIGGYVQHDKSRRGKPSEFDRAAMTFEDEALGRAEDLLLAMAV